MRNQSKADDYLAQVTALVEQGALPSDVSKAVAEAASGMAASVEIDKPSATLATRMTANEELAAQTASRASALETRADASEDSIADSAQAIANLQLSVAALQSLVSAQGMQISELEVTVADLQSQITTLDAAKAPLVHTHQAQEIVQGAHSERLAPNVIPVGDSITISWTDDGTFLYAEVN